MAFLNRLAEIAEREGHHPDFCLKRWNRVSLALTTHAIGDSARQDIGRFAVRQQVDQLRAAGGVRDGDRVVVLGFTATTG
jgi:4a-hydroxytetrahydrobiopterin dehydratase